MTIRLILTFIIGIFTVKYSSLWELSAILIFSYIFIEFIQNIGVKFGLLEIVLPLAALLHLLIPALTYIYFNENNELAFLWKTFMPIKSDEYFSFMVPACVLFFIGLKLPFKQYIIDENKIKINASLYIGNASKIAIAFVAIGVVFNVILKVLPGSIRGIGNYFALLTFVGLFYAIFSESKNKIIIIIFCLISSLYQCVAEGMYGEFVYMSAFTMLVFLLGKDIRLYTKLLVVSSGIVLVLFIQSIKFEYREKIWNGLDRNGGNSSAFLGLVSERIANPSEIFKPDRLYEMTVRTNQGRLVAQLLYNVPYIYPYANGETILKAFLSAPVPRIFWPNKPKIGGGDNMCRFFGDCDYTGTSYNLGPIGEAYVNFGRIGGILFMFLYGLIMKFMYVSAIRISEKYPTIVFWFPLLFLCHISMENDVLGYINSLTKAAMFTYFVYFLSYKVLKVKI